MGGGRMDSTFRVSGTVRDRREYRRGFGYQGNASRQGWEREVAELGIGAAMKEAHLSLRSLSTVVGFR